MAIKLRGYRLDSHKFYPRPNHFKKRLDSLIPRFKNVNGAFGEPFHDQKWLQKIYDSYHLMGKSIVVSLMGDEKQSFDLNRFVIHEADEWATVPDPFSTSTFERAGLYITVCFITVEDTGAKGKETAKRAIEHVSNCLNQNNNDRELFKSLFVFCELSEYCSESEKTSFREYISGCLVQMSTQWPGPSRIVLGPDHVTLGSLLSDYIEENILQTFWLIYEYLNNRFVCKVHSQYDVLGDVAHVTDVENALYNFVRNDIELADWMFQLKHLDEDTRTETARFVDDVLDYLAKKLKCDLVRPLSTKLGLKRDVCNTCLDAIRFDKIIRNKLSSSTKVNLKKLHPVSKNYEEILEQVIKDGPRRKVNKGNDYMIPRLQNDVSAVLSEVETELKKAVKMISIMGKMTFEIESYFRLAGVLVGKPPVKIPADLQQDLLKIDGVVGAGTIYGILEVHVRDMIQMDELKMEIDDTFRRHKNDKHYKVRTVTKEVQQLANVQHEHGNMNSMFP